MGKLKEQLQAELSRNNTDLIAKYIGNDPDKFRELMQFLLLNKKDLSNRAAWAVETIWVQTPELINPYIDQLLALLPNVSNHGLKRHILKILAGTKIPESKLVNLIDYCFECLQSPDDYVAAKVHSMQIIYNFCLKEPYLKYELISVIEDQADKNSIAFISRGKKIIKALSKL